MCNCIKLWLLAYLFFIQIDCYLCFHSGNSSRSIYDTCGLRRHMADVLRLFIVCYKSESVKSYPKRHMGYYGRWWCGFCITICGKRQWLDWKFTGINAVLGNFLQLLQYCLISHYVHDCHTIFGLSLPRTSPHSNLTKLYQINKLSYNPTQVIKTNIKLLKVAIQLTLNNKP